MARFINLETGEVHNFRTEFVPRKVSKREVDYNGHLSPAQRRVVRRIALEHDPIWKRYDA